MPHSNFKDEAGSHGQRRLRTKLDLPVIGMESEFNVWLDGEEINPEPYWKHPSAFIDRPLLVREKTSLQLPTGGAVYFDRGVIEVVTPVIELAPESTARMVRNLWEQIGFVRDQLTRWGKQHDHTVRLKAYSSHYNISYEIPKSQQTKERNIQKLALLLAYILPVPVMLLASNRRSTGVGVRPRGDRMEITVDFTPDPGLMLATATCIVGIVREIMWWPSYDLSMLEKLPIPVIAGVVPGKHTTRKGWLTKDFHYETSPYTADIDAPIWQTQFGDKRSLRTIGLQVAWFFRRSIRKYSDPFSMRLMFAILTGRAPSMLELVDRPTAYEDVGNLCRWGSVIHELKSYDAEMSLLKPSRQVFDGKTIDEYIADRVTARAEHLKEMATVNAAESQPHDVRRVAAAAAAPARRATPRPQAGGNGKGAQQPATARAIRPLRRIRRQADTPGRLMPERPAPYVDRRGLSLLEARVVRDRRRRAERRKRTFAIPFPDRRLTRSAYEQVFLKLVRGGRLRVGKDIYPPIGMKGWYHAIFRRESDGAERLLSIDQLLKKMGDWI